MARIIDLNGYLASFPGVYFNDKIVVTKINKIPINSMSNSYSKKAYIQGFDCESITFKKAVNMFDHMEISESIYKGLV